MDLDIKLLTPGAHASKPAILLLGPYDPHCGEYTFLALLLGVWRLAGVLGAAGFRAEVFDPNCCAGPPQRALERELLRLSWDLIGFSTTGMTLRFDLELAHLARRIAPQALFVAGGMEATFRPELMFELGPFDRVVLGEGERPLIELAARLRAVEPVASPGLPNGFPTTAYSNPRSTHSRRASYERRFSQRHTSACRRAGFRVLGFGIENFSPQVLREFNKAKFMATSRRCCASIVPKAERAHVAPIVPLYLLCTLIHVVPMSIGFANWITMKLARQRLYRDHYEPGDSRGALHEASSETAQVLRRERRRVA